MSARTKLPASSRPTSRVSTRMPLPSRPEAAPIAPFLETVATYLETPEVVLLTEGSRPSDAPGYSPAGSFTRYPHLVCSNPRLPLASTISEEETRARRPSKRNDKGFPCVAHPPVARGMSSQPRQPTYSLFSITKTNTHVSRGFQVPSTEIGRLGGCPSAHGRNIRFGGPRSLKNAFHVSSSTHDRTSDTPSPECLDGGTSPSTCSTQIKTASLLHAREAIQASTAQDAFHSQHISRCPSVLAAVSYHPGEPKPTSFTTRALAPPARSRIQATGSRPQPFLDTKRRLPASAAQRDPRTYPRGLAPASLSRRATLPIRGEPADSPLDRSSLFSKGA